MTTKKEYTSPKLTVHGDVETVTQANVNGMTQDNVRITNNGVAVFGTS